MNINKIVLVEEEPEIREIWRRIAKVKELDLTLFGDPEDFLNDIEKLRDCSSFFLDQDFGPTRRGEGLVLARFLRSYLPSKEVFLVTNYPRSEFLREIQIGILDDVYGKFPPIIQLEDQNEFNRIYIDSWHSVHLNRAGNLQGREDANAV